MRAKNDALAVSNGTFTVWISSHDEDSLRALVLRGRPEPNAQMHSQQSQVAAKTNNVDD